MQDKQIEAVERLWAVRMKAPFPPGARGAEVAGVDLVLLDADTSGCITTWLNSGG
jgi:hypothetical protein